jgi:membrane protein
VKRLLFTLLLTLLIPALLIFEVLGDSIAGAICSFIRKIGHSEPEKLESMINTIFNTSSLVVLIFALLVILLMYAKLPAVHRTLKSQLPGAVITLICWIAFTELFVFFVPRFYKASALYGSLAALFVALLWLRIMVMILFGGKVLNKTLEDERQDC